MKELREVYKILRAREKFSASRFRNPKEGVKNTALPPVPILEYTLTTCSGTRIGEMCCMHAMKWREMISNQNPQIRCQRKRQNELKYIGSGEKRQQFGDAHL